MNSGLTKDLFPAGMLNEELQEQIEEAWEKKLTEAREEISAELREEFARRYEHDKDIMVEAAERMFSEALESELKEFTEDRSNLSKARVRYEKQIKEHIDRLNQFVLGKLSGEVKELYNDRKKIAEGFKKFEDFSVRQMSKELKEFQEDKKDLARRKVQLVSEARNKLNETKKSFIKRAAVVAEGVIENSLRTEIATFRKDIKEARQNMFGRKIFEAVASEFMTSHFNKDKELSKLSKAIQERESKINEAEETVNALEKKLEESQRRIRIAEDKAQRNKVINELYRPLSREQRAVMDSLLEGVQTKDLERQFKKHIGYVLKEDTKAKNKSTTLNESTSSNRPSYKEVTGNKKSNRTDTSNAELENWKALAGIKQ